MQRRSFIKSTIAGAAGLLGLKATVKAEATPADEWLARSRRVADRIRVIYLRHPDGKGIERLKLVDIKGRDITIIRGA